jgi:hypothetical protein
MKLSLFPEPYAVFESILIQIAKAFDAAAIPYMIIGGQAVLYSAWFRWRT